MSGMDLTAFNAALKEHYTSDRVEDMVYKDNPFLAMLPKMENFGGKNLPIPIKYGNPQGRSKTFATAQAGAASYPSKLGSFALTRVKDYAVAIIDGETMKASKGDANAFMDAATCEVDGALESLTRSVAVNLPRTVAASIGRVLAEPAEQASFVVTLTDIEEIVNVEVGQVHLMYSAASGGTQRSIDGSILTMPVIAVNRSLGTITYSGTYNSSGTIAPNDYIFINGDRGLGISGLEDWIPATAPGATSFFGVDRSVDVTRLGGLRYDGSGGPIEEVLTEADRLVSREGFAIDHFFMNHANFANLKKALGTKVQYVDLQVNPRISFRGVVVDGNRGPIKVIPDNTFPSNRIFGLKLSMWKLYSIGKAISVIEDDGLEWLRQASADGVELRIGFYGNLGCRAPGANINVQI